MSGVIVFDVETHSTEQMYEMDPHDFVRLIGYKEWNDSHVTITSDLDHFRSVLLDADGIVGHNIHMFDLRAVFGPESDTPVWLSDQDRVFDTWTHAVLVHPAPHMYTNRLGQKALADTPDKMKRWFSLDEQAFQLGVSGKTDNLRELALEFGDSSLSKSDRIADGLARIPIDDERYVSYLEGDVHASQSVASGLLGKGQFNAYAKREQRIEARKAKISSNGFRVDQEQAVSRRDSLRERRDTIVSELSEKYDFPTEGKAPWATDAGKNAIFSALESHGFNFDDTSNWPKTVKGNFSLSGDALKSMTQGTSAEELGSALAELKGQRSLSQLALDSTYSDGFVHPEITMLQRSGRWSTTNPGLTVWTASGDGAVEKEYFIPDSGDEVLIELDYSNADARFVAAVSGDKKYAERFQPGEDGHLHNAWAVWGKDTVGTDKSDPVTAQYRQSVKAPGHGWNYGLQPNKMSQITGLSLKDSKKFVENMNKTYDRVAQWQDRKRAEARKLGYVQNIWGRKMPVESGREFTQGPALDGQSGTREVICDALLRMSYDELRCVKAQVHDALVVSVPRAYAQAAAERFKQVMETSVNPGLSGQKIDFPVDYGQPAENWYTATH